MKIIAASTWDLRIVAFVLFGLTFFPLFFGLISLERTVLLPGLGMLLVSTLLYFFGSCTYTISYDEEAGLFTIVNRKERVTINKKNVLAVRQRLTIFQSHWPLPSRYHYVLIVRNQNGKKSLYRFVIWSDEPVLLKNYRTP